MNLANEEEMSGAVSALTRLLWRWCGWPMPKVALLIEISDTSAATLLAAAHTRVLAH